MEEGYLFHVGHDPDDADLFYTYRPLAEIDAIVAEAQRLGVATLWRQPGPDDTDADAEAWRARVAAAGLRYLDAPPIEQVARTITG